MAANVSSTSDEPDVYGQVHPHETPELIVEKLMELEQELEKIPPEQTSAYQQATTKCPQFTNQEWKLMFLRCEVFDTKLTAKRLIKYWEKRLELFGPDKAFLPLTQNGALRDDIETLRHGVFRIFPASYIQPPSNQGDSDCDCRSTLLFSGYKVDSSKFDRLSVIRTLWYLIHIAVMENTRTQQRGLITFGYCQFLTLSQYDRPLNQLTANAVRGYLPVRISAIHICHAPLFFRILIPIIKLIMGERLRHRIHLHKGAFTEEGNERVAKSLARFGLLKRVVPMELGGDLNVPHEEWLQAQQRHEEEAKDNKTKNEEQQPFERANE